MLYQGDNTQSFGGNFVRITAVCKDSQGNPMPMPALTKAEIRCGCVIKTYENPTFPLDVNFTEEETEKMGVNNSMFLAVWDYFGRKKTANGSLKFNTTPRRV